MPSIIGAIVASSDVEAAVSSTVAVWIDSYLTEIEAQQGLTQYTISRPASYLTTYDFENWPEGALPAIAVVCNDTVGTPDRDGEYINAWFEVAVHAIVDGQTEPEARLTAGRYQAAVATLIMQQASLRGAGSTQFAASVMFDGYQRRLSDVSNRTLAVGTANFRVLVTGIMDVSAGPAGGPPPAVMPGSWPIAETINVSVTG